MYMYISETETETEAETKAETWAETRVEYVCPSPRRAMTAMTLPALPALFSCFSRPTGEQEAGGRQRQNSTGRERQTHRPTESACWQIMCVSKRTIACYIL